LLAQAPAGTVRHALSREWTLVVWHRLVSHTHSQKGNAADALGCLHMNPAGLSARGRLHTISDQAVAADTASATIVYNW
jgi:hypothetical protein